MTPDRGEFVLHTLVERIVHFRPIQRHLGDVVTNVVGDRRETVRYGPACSSDEPTKRRQRRRQHVCPFRR